MGSTVQLNQPIFINIFIEFRYQVKVSKMNKKKSFKHASVFNYSYQMHALSNLLDFLVSYFTRLVIVNKNANTILICVCVCGRVCVCNISHKIHQKNPKCKTPNDVNKTVNEMSSFYI